MTASILKDRYQLIAKAGEGRFAITYFARDLETARECVVKQLSFRSLSEWKELELFEREAQTLSHLTHARIPRFIDLFKFEDEDGLQICSVQEYIQGRTLAQLIDAERPFTETEIVRIGIELAKILEYLHGFSPPVVHRDIKPSNVLLKESGDVYLIDFGCVVAHALGEQERGSTIVGTYGYMPPEQFAGQPIPASDVYSLGATLIYLLTRRDPGTLANLDGRLEFERPNHVSPQLARVLRKMVQREPRKRLRSGVEVRVALERVAGGKTDPTVSRRLFSTAAGLGVVLGVAAALFSPMIRQAPGTASTVREPKSIVDVPLPPPAPRYTALARPSTSEPTCVLTGSVPSHAEVFGDFKLLPSGLRAEARRRAGAVGSAPGRPAEEWGPLGFTPLCLLPGSLISFYRPGYNEAGWVSSGQVVKLIPAREFEGTWRLHDQSLRAFERSGDEVIEYALESVGARRKEIARHDFQRTEILPPNYISTLGQTIQFVARGRECDGAEYRYRHELVYNWRSTERLESRTRVCSAGGVELTQWARAVRAD